MKMMGSESAKEMAEAVTADSVTHAPAKVILYSNINENRVSGKFISGEVFCAEVMGSANKYTAMSN